MYAFEKRRKNKTALNESISVDKIIADIGKAQDSVDKSIESLEALAASMVLVSNDAVETGGRIKDVIPSNVEVSVKQVLNLIKSLQDIKEGQAQTSLKNLENLVLNMPVRDVLPKEPEDQVDEILMKPDLSDGPKSAVLANESAAPMLSMETLHEHLGGDMYDAITEKDDPFSELNARLSENGKAYLSPIKEMEFLNGEELSTRSDGISFDLMSPLSADNESDVVADDSSAALSDSLVFDDIGTALPANSDDSLMADFENAPIGDSAGSDIEPIGSSGDSMMDDFAAAPVSDEDDSALMMM